MVQVQVQLHRVRVLVVLLVQRLLQRLLQRHCHWQVAPLPAPPLLRQPQMQQIAVRIQKQSKSHRSVPLRRSLKQEQRESALRALAA